MGSESDSQASPVEAASPARGKTPAVRRRLFLMLLMTIAAGVLLYVVGATFWSRIFPRDHLDWTLWARPYVLCLPVPVLFGIWLKRRLLNWDRLTRALCWVVAANGIVIHLTMLWLAWGAPVSSLPGPLKELEHLRRHIGHIELRPLRRLYYRGPLVEGAIYGAVSLPWWFLLLAWRADASAAVPPPPSVEKRKRARRVVLVAAAAIVLVQGVSYLLWAERTWPAAGVMFLPLDRDRHLEFACVPEKSWASLSAGQRAALEKELRRHFKLVYHGEGEIPAANKVYSERQPGGLSWLKGGLIITVKRASGGPFWFTGGFGHWMTGTAASFRGDTFIWLLGSWINVYNHHHAVS